MAKVLDSRLVKVMGNLISSKHSTFVKGRKLVNGVVALNEVLDLARRLKRKFFMFKVYFQKACDSVSWSFLDYLLVKFEFDGRRRACVFFKSHSMLVNGFLAVEINIYKCLKQGDPLAHFLFLLVI